MPMFIPAAMMVVGTATSVAGSIMGGQAQADAAKQQAKISMLDSEKSMLNAVLGQYEADRVKQETALDADWLNYSADREAKWTYAINEYDRKTASAQTDRAAATAIEKYTTLANISVDNAVAESDAVRKAVVEKVDVLKGIAEAKAQTVTATGEVNASATRTKSNYQLVMQQVEDEGKIGAQRASFGARQVAFTGSSLDVLEHEQALARAKQDMIRIAGSFGAEDILYESRSNALMQRLNASGEAQAAFGEAGAKIGEKLRKAKSEVQYYDMMKDTAIYEYDAALQEKLVKNKVETDRKVDMIQEEAWRVVMKMNMGSQNQQSQIMAKSAEDMTKSTVSSASSEIQRNSAAAVQSASTVSAIGQGISGLGSAASSYMSMKK